MILHLDADAFYVSCEQAADARLRDKMIAVGGLRRGIIASACYAARKRGIYTPMPSQKALQICPELHIVRSNFERYEWFSRTMFGVIAELTPLLERTSIDEGYFQLPSNSPSTPETVARQLQTTLWERLRLPVSFGIATSKLVSQIASKLNKPRALVTVPPGSEAAFMAPLDVKWLPGVGGTTEAALKHAGFHLVQHVAEAATSRLTAAIGDSAHRLRQHALGLDDRPLRLDRADSQSYSHQETFSENLTDPRRIERLLRSLLDDLVKQAVADHKSARTLAVRIRLHGMKDTERSDSLPEPSSLAEDFYPLIPILMRKAWDHKSPVRLAAIRLSNLHDGVIAGDLFTREQKTRRLALQQTITELQKRYGKQALQRGHSLDE